MLGLIEELERQLQRAVRLPGNKVVVDENAMREVLAELRAAVPDEVQLGQRIATERERILTDARAQTRRMAEEAQVQAAAHVEESAIVQAARERGRNILAEAERSAEELRAQTDQYVASQLTALEGRLQRLLREIQAGQRFLTQSQADASRTRSQQS